MLCMALPIQSTLVVMVDSSDVDMALQVLYGADSDQEDHTITTGVAVQQSWVFLHQAPLHQPVWTRE